MSNGLFRPAGQSAFTPVVINLLIVNGLFFVAAFLVAPAYSIDLNGILGLRYPGSESFRPYQFITYMFMHGSLWHLFFNMFALWMFGSTLENLWGPKRFLSFYLITGIGASLIHYFTIYLSLRADLALMNNFLNNPGTVPLNELINNHKFQLSQFSGEIWIAFNAFQRDVNQLAGNPDNFGALQRSIDFIADYKVFFLNRPNVIGASGAVFGILLAFGMIFPNVRIYLYMAIPVKAKYFVIFYGLLELYLGFSRTSGNIAHFAHLGGMLFGYLVLLYWKHTDKPKFF
jgi:membrane associated rhomboid family serine protease